MNLLTNKYCLTSIFLFVIFTIEAQKTDLLFKKADSLAVSGNTTGSAVEYERIVFLAYNVDSQRKAIYKKAMVYKNAGKYTEASETLERLNIRNPEDTLFAQKNYQLAFCQYMNGNYKDAINTIELYEAVASKENTIRPQILTVKIFCYNHLFEFDKAIETLTKLEKLSNTNGNYKKIKNMYVNLPKYKDPEKARHLSLLPGLGQAYCGEIVEGSINFLLNASALGFGAWQVWNGYYFTGYVVGVTLLQKFHSGGQHRAEIIAREKNIENAAKFNRKILEEFDF
jgi:tetratricopeptide (TPR) repeat protein